MNRLFWVVVAIDAALFVILLTLGLTRRPEPDGGSEMALAFSVIIPGIIVAAGIGLFLWSPFAASRAIALLIVAGPPMLIVVARARSAAIDVQVRRNAEGSGYFSDNTLKSAGMAVVRRDVPALNALKGHVDVNAKGSDGMTLMALAVSEAFDHPSPTAAGASSLDVVRALLALGADPNLGLETATKIPDISILNALLDAGAKPSFADGRRAVIFPWLGVIPQTHFIALLDRGVDPNASDEYGTPLIIETARNDRWNLVLVLIDRGADPLRPDRRGTRLADVVASRLEPTTTARPPEVLADIGRVKTRIDEAAARR